MNTQNDEPLVMDLSQLAVALHCSRNLIYSLARQGKLPVKVIHVGARRMVVSRRAVQRLLEGNNTQEETESCH